MPRLTLWVELPSSALQGRHCGSWNLLWTWRPPKINFAELLPWQVQLRTLAAAAFTYADSGARACASASGAASGAARCDVRGVRMRCDRPRAPPVPPWQRVNHFPQSKNLTRKDLLKKHLQRQRQLSGRSSELMPLTYVLPAEYLAFVEAYARCEEEKDGANVWIMKPVGSSRGRGISIISDVSEASYHFLRTHVTYHPGLPVGPPLLTAHSLLPR